jgi:Tfp pilus assembly protein PilF
VSGDLEEACKLYEQAASLKERALGPEHSDVALGLVNLALCRATIGQAERGLADVNRAIEIYKSAQPDTASLGNLHGNKGDVLLALGRYREAEAEFVTALNALGSQPDAHPDIFSQCLHGLGEVSLVREQPVAAAEYLQRALSIRESKGRDLFMTAETRFALAQALWERRAARGRARARALAIAARDGYAEQNRSSKEHAVVEWLDRHKPIGRRAALQKTALGDAMSDRGTRAAR